MRLLEALGDSLKLWKVLGGRVGAPGGAGRRGEALADSGKHWEALEGLWETFGRLWEALGGLGRLRETLGEHREALERACKQLKHRFRAAQATQIEYYQKAALNCTEIVHLRKYRNQLF